MFTSVVPRMPQEHKGGFPRPMLNMDTEETRNGWDGNTGKSITASDRWKGGIFDGNDKPDLPVMMKGRGPSLYDQVEASPIRYSDMKTATTRTTVNTNAFRTHEGTRNGCTASLKPQTAPSIGPGAYDIEKGRTIAPRIEVKTKGGRSQSPSLASTVPRTSAFRSRIPRDFYNVHPKTTVAGKSPNTVMTKHTQKHMGALYNTNNFDLSWDSKHWARAGRTSTITAHETPTAMQNTVDASFTPGPGFYLGKTSHWEDEPRSSVVAAGRTTRN